MKYIILYLFSINVVGFLLMGMDKRRAMKNLWRIPEKTLFFTSLAGGSIGSILGMQFFRHKTKHTSFVIGMPCILLFQIALILFLVFRYRL